MSDILAQYNPELIKSGDAVWLKKQHQEFTVDEIEERQSHKIDHDGQSVTKVWYEANCFWYQGLERKEKWLRLTDLTKVMPDNNIWRA